MVGFLPCVKLNEVIPQTMVAIVSHVTTPNLHIWPIANDERMVNTSCVVQNRDLAYHHLSTSGAYNIYNCLCAVYNGA